MLANSCCYWNQCLYLLIAMRNIPGSIPARIEFGWLVVFPLDKRKKESSLWKKVCLESRQIAWAGMVASQMLGICSTILSFCSTISMCGIHLQSYLIIQDGCWSFCHHICVAGRKREKAKGQKKRVPSQMCPISLSSLPVSLPPTVLLKSCVPDISHLAKPWCKGGWEIQSFPLSMCPAKSLHFITKRGEWM